MTKKFIFKAPTHTIGSTMKQVWRTGIMLVLVLMSVVFAWIFATQQTTHAAGLIEVPTQTNPWGVTLDGNGHIWVAEPGCDVSPSCATAFSSYIGEYLLSDGSLVKNYAEPANFSSPVFIVKDKKGRLWFTETNSNAIGMLRPGTTPPTWKQWSVPTAKAIPYDLTLDNNGNIWFSEFSANKIGFFNTTTYAFVETSIPSAGASPYGITKAPNGDIWFAENALAKIGSFTPTTTGHITIAEHTINTSSPHLITADKYGNIWYSQGFSGVIGEYIPSTGVHKDFQVSTGICPNPNNCPGTHISGISTDGKGMVWFDDSLDARVGYLNPQTGVFKAIRLTNTSAHPHDGLIVDGRNNVWFTELYASKLGKVLPGTI